MFSSRWMGSLCRLMLVATTLVTGSSQHVRASDHADPMFLQQLEAGITDLFAFPKDDSLVIILCVRRGLADGTPLPLQPYTYRIHIDHHSQVDFDDPDTLARYGGKVMRPEGIDADVEIAIQLADQPQPTDFVDNQPRRLSETLVRSWKTKGLSTPSKVRIWSGICDDPFIFFRFLTTNCVAMVVEIPLSQFPEEQDDYLIWATSHKFGKQIDHVGRSLRTMLPRFEVLNTLHPSEHVKTLKQRHQSPDVITDVASTLIPPLFGLRHYDFQPDVMIFTRRNGLTCDGKPYGDGYPNGRRLEDDVAQLCCAQGDCLLYEVSLAEAHAEDQEIPTENLQPFHPEFPYLAEPNASPMPQAAPSLRLRTKLILATLALVALAIIVLPWWLYLRTRRMLLAARQRR